MRKPDFARVRRALLLQGEPDFVPIFDGVHVDVKKAFLGRPIAGLKDEVDFAVAAGYDFVLLGTGFESLMRAEALADDGKESSGRGAVFKVQQARYSVHSDAEGKRAWANEGRGKINNLREFEEFPWPDLSNFDFSKLEEIKRFLPQGMKVIITMDGVFTPAWQVMGQETFYLSLIRNPELVGKVFDKIGAMQYAIIEKVTSFDSLGALRISDDIAYKSRTLVSPKHLRKYFFPWLKRVGDLCKDRDLPFIYHSDGNIGDVVGDIIDAGVKGLHPIEPLAMDIRELKKRVGDKLCLLGNIDLDVIARGTPAEVRELVLRNLRDIAPGGGYLAGSSNSIPEFVPLNNYNALRETALEHGRFPISL
ncbi:MAG: nucleoside 2-deoxyribosyltransferase [Chloroflexi bacterium]|nr:nucleoside 2-deoxyribosyltransferase [Chloroflexota bacterium]